MEEVWKDIPGYEGFYQVSNLGRVRSHDSLMVHRSGKKYIRKGKILKYKDNHGYLRVGLGGKNNQKWYFVHRLVYEAFIGHIPEGMQVNHIDENKKNNFIWVNPDGSVDIEKSNLNLMTPKENTNYGTGPQRSIRKRKVPVTQILSDGTEFFSYFSAADAEAELGIWNSNIIKCCNGRRKAAGGYMWKYANPERKWSRSDR